MWESVELARWWGSLKSRVLVTPTPKVVATFRCGPLKVACSGVTRKVALVHVCF